jgi:hypothetical protein
VQRKYRLLGRSLINFSAQIRISDCTSLFGHAVLSSIQNVRVINQPYTMLMTHSFQQCQSLMEFRPEMKPKSFRCYYVYSF